MKHDHRELHQQLKTLTLDVFNGDKESYPQWQSMFFKTIHVMDIDVDIKYNWLMRHVSENIKKELIRGISHSAFQVLLRCLPTRTSIWNGGHASSNHVIQTAIVETV